MGSGAAASHPPQTHPPPLSSSTRSSDPEKEFKCPICSRVFNKKANLKVHSRKHTGEKPYVCSRPGCGRSFMWKSSVTFHEQNCPSLKKPVGATADVPNVPPSAPGATTPSNTTLPTRVGSRGVQKRPKGGNTLSSVSLAAMVPGPGPGGKKRKNLAADLNKRDDVARVARQMAKVANEGIIPNRSVAPGPLMSASGHSGGNYSPPPVHTLFAEADTAGALPAPSVLLGGKRMTSGGGKPPMIPGVRGLYTLPKDNVNGKVLFDLRVPSGGTGKAGSLHVGKMPKMPIAMELDDSDDEGTEKIVGAQDAFMRTGNPFGGFAPPTRCSPLPISSPIVCPGISPMPLSPLAPFSPLPPDSPAHNAPNPVHPPLNQPTARPNTPGW